MKRNILSTIFEFIFPVLCLAIIVGLRYAFPIETSDFVTQEQNFDFFVLNKSVSNIDVNSITPSDLDMVNRQWIAESIIPPLSICSQLNMHKTERPKIASVGIPLEIKQRMIVDSLFYKDFINYFLTDDSFLEFETIEKMEEYIKDPMYGSNDLPLVCFGMRFSYDENNKKYNYSLHFFDSDNIQKGGIYDVKNLREGLFDQFQTGPDLTSFSLYRNNGFTYLMKLVNEYILQQETGDSNASINFGVQAMKYIDNRVDSFGELLGYMITIFIVIAYMCPLCLYVFRIVYEKETKSKEGMKIMGLGEGEYFLSYFIQYVIVAIPVSLANAYLLQIVLTLCPYYYLFLIFFVWSLDVFALIYFFQSFIDKTRLAIVLSILIYFVMYCLSLSCMYEFSPRVIKLVLSIFPAVSVNLGILLLSKFESHFKRYHGEYFMDHYTNYSMALMFLMLVVDFLIFLFLGFYLQNVLPHDFGIKKPWYFLCTSNYWCGPKKDKEDNKSVNKSKKSKNTIVEKKLGLENEENQNNEVNKNSRNMEIPSNDQNALPQSQDIPLVSNIKKKKTKVKKKKTKKNTSNSFSKEVSQNKNQDKNNSSNINLDLYNGDPNFQSESIYKDKTKNSDVLQIRNIVKIFGDGKKAVDHVNLNFFKDEIFALLGHNGAGKTTLISMLTGLYEATEGNVFYDGINILEGTNMDEFRRKLGICPQHDILFDDLSIREHLEMFSIFKGVPSIKVEEEVNKVLHDFQIEDIQNMIAKNLSAGQRRKLSICIALTGGSKVIFLDEPSSGMDITSRRNLWEILKRQSEDKIIILTTHYMEEASVLGKRIGIINAGQMKCIGSPLFLIEKFGKFMSLNITKEEDADNDQIVDFIKHLAPNVEYEILSEEIMFRIPKFSDSGNNGKHNNDLVLKNNKKFSFSDFFELLDNNLNKLRIKSYSASMPTLEDVFLNVAAEDSKKQSQNQKDNQSQNSNSQNNNCEIVDIEKNDEILFNTNFREDYSTKSKFCNDFKSCFKRRFLLTIRDIKGFALEILCPIVLVLIGLAVGKVKMSKEDLPLHMDISAIGKQNILYAGIDGINNLEDYYIKDQVNVTNSKVDGFNENNKKNAVIKFINSVYEVSKTSEDSSLKEIDMTAKDYTGYYGALLMLQESSNHYEFVELINSRIKHGVPIYTHYILKQIVEKAAGHKVDIEFVHYPMPLTYQLDEQSGSGNNIIIVFFVAIAFSLIPANFITVLAKEKVNNSKHLMRVSGINIIAYWLVNYIYELVKYYFTAGICILLLWAFDQYEDYLYILYLSYGPGMISLTYIMSFWFDNESTAQNAVILLNFLVGALGSLVAMTLRSIERFKLLGKILEYIFAIIPTFCFDFGYDLLLNKMMIYMRDYKKEEYMSFTDDVIIKKMNLLMSVCIFAIAECFIYTILLVVVESRSYSSKKVPVEKLDSCTTDSMVLKEIERANEGNLIENTNYNIIKDNNTNDLSNENDKNNVKINVKEINQENSQNYKYSVCVKNLKKVYYSGCCSKNSENIEAIKNLNFCIEPGECFGLLGLNGAGKTTTFKCITQELSPTNGQIFINGEDVSNKFSSLSSLFGYCPQFDAIFEYMTVKENLEFYARIKGVKLSLLDQLVQAMIAEMALDEFTNKISGRLSGGNKRKLAVAISMLCNPPIILLDEPSTGMDPEARRFMWSVIHKMSTKGKKSSVIMTTHSMDEAETLCRRMGIMVNGEFVCLGRAGQIKEKYGYGYEADIRIKPMDDNLAKDIYENYFDEKNIAVDKNNIEDILVKIGRKEYINELEDNRLGSKIIRDIKINGNISFHTLISWIFFVENALKFISKGKQYFDEIILSEHIENNFLFKMKKGNQHKSIGFFFGLFEGSKEACYITEYSIQQTSLEQIFNKFAGKQLRDKTKEKQKNNHNGEFEEEIIGFEDDENKKEIIVNDELLSFLVKKK